MPSFTWLMHSATHFGDNPLYVKTKNNNNNNNYTNNNNTPNTSGNSFDNNGEASSVDVPLGGEPNHLEDDPRRTSDSSTGSSSSGSGTRSSTSSSAASSPSPTSSNTSYLFPSLQQRLSISPCSKRYGLARPLFIATSTPNEKKHGSRFASVRFLQIASNNVSIASDRQNYHQEKRSYLRFINVLFCFVLFCFYVPVGRFVTSYSRGLLL